MPRGARIAVPLTLTQARARSKQVAPRGLEDHMAVGGVKLQQLMDKMFSDVGIDGD